MIHSKMIKSNKDLVALRINTIRSDLGLSIGVMAEKIGISKSTLNSYIRALAMPPERIVYKISILSGRSIEWIYFGDKRDYIRQLLEFYGYSQFLSDYPTTIDHVLDRSQEYMAYPIEHRYAHDLHIKEVFEQIYYPIIVRYVDELINKYVDEIHKYPIYPGDDEYQRSKYSNLVHKVIKQNTVKYGEEGKILLVAETEFKRFVDHYAKNKELVPCDDEPQPFPYRLSTKLRDKKGTIEVIEYLSRLYGEGFDTKNEAADEIIKAFKDLGLELEKIYSKYSDPTY